MKPSRLHYFLLSMMNQATNKRPGISRGMARLFAFGSPQPGAAQAERRTMNHRDLTRIALATTVLLFLAGCRTSRDLGTGDWQSLDSISSTEALMELMTNRDVQFRFAHGQQRIELSQTKLTDATSGISLVKVNGDGEVVIDVSRTGEQLRAYPGKPFLGAYQEVTPGILARTFGECGLQVISSDPKAQSAILQRAVGAHSYRIKR